MGTTVALGDHGTQVFTEFEGDKKLKSLPYTFLVTTHTRDASGEAKVRVGSRVPVYTGGGQNVKLTNQFGHGNLNVNKDPKLLCVPSTKREV